MHPRSSGSAGSPGYCSGELIAAIAMTEPEAGSDLQGIRSTAVRVVKGNAVGICYQSDAKSQTGF